MFKFIFGLGALNLFLFLSTQSYAAETFSEKAMVRSKDSVRALNKIANRIEENLCVGGDFECVTHKLGNVASEAKDAVVDGSAEVIAKLD